MKWSYVRILNQSWKNSKDQISIIETVWHKIRDNFQLKIDIELNIVLKHKKTHKNIIYLAMTSIMKKKIEDGKQKVSVVFLFHNYHNISKIGAKCFNYWFNSLK